MQKCIKNKNKSVCIEYDTLGIKGLRAALSLFAKTVNGNTKLCSTFHRLESCPGYTLWFMH